MDLSGLEYQKDRYIKAISEFEANYGQGDIEIYSAPGRSEIGGNHIDHQHGYNIGGFSAYITSDVLIGAGLSSSAAYETLIGTIISGLYNHMSVSPVEIAMIGQYAENVYFGKPCGLMDQMACSVGNLVHTDFADTKSQLLRRFPLIWIRCLVKEHVYA